MARVQYTAIINEIVGKIRGTVFQKSQGGNIARGKERGYKNSTTKQSLQQQSFKEQIISYKALSFNSQSLWNIFASTYTFIDIYGASKTITGFNWFNSINMNLKVISENALSDPPVYNTTPNFPTAQFLVGLNSMLLHIDARVTDSDLCVVIKTSVPVFGYKNKYRRLLRQTTVDVSGDYLTFDLYNDWLTCHNIDLPNPDLNNSYNIVCEAYYVRKSTGIAGLASNFVCRASSDNNWSPALLIGDGLLRWHDGSGLVTNTNNSYGTVDSSNRVSNFKDLSGNGFDLLQATTNYMPVLSSLGVSFDGSNDRLETALNGSSSIVSIAICYKKNSTSSGGTIFTNPSSTVYLSVANTSIVLHTLASYSYAYGFNATNDLNKHSLIVTYNAGDTLLYFNNVLTKQNTLDNYSLQGFKIGCNASSSSNFNNYTVYEIVVLNRLLTAEERGKLNTYFVNKWGSV